MLECKRVITAAISASDYPELLDRFTVKDYPRLLWIPRGSTMPVAEFSGTYSTEKIVGWVAHQHGNANKLWSPMDDPPTDDSKVVSALSKERCTPSVSFNF